MVEIEVAKKNKRKPETFHYLFLISDLTGGFSFI
jgi:hypothetical protein